MTYAIPGQPAKQPPTPVRVAVALLWAVVALRLVAIGLSFVPTPELDQALEDLYGGNPPPGAAAGTALGVGFSIVVGIVLSGAFAVLAVFLSKGSQAARITTWVFGGIVTLCMTCGVIASLLAPSLLSSMTNATDPEAQRAAEEAQLILDKTPTWLTVTSTAIEVLVVLALLVALILLAVPSANAFFRKEEEVWVPPTTPGAGGYPPYPPPPSSQQPPSPPAPPAGPGQPPYPPTQS